MDRLDKGRGSYFSQLYKDGQRATSLAFTDLNKTTHISSIDPGLFRGSQISALCGALPLFVLSHVIASLSLAKILYDYQQEPQSIWWLASAFVPLGLLAVLWVKNDKNNPHSGIAKIHWVELLAILFGVTWALCPTIFFASADPNVRVLVIGVTLAIAAVGTFAFSSVPSAAILYSGLITFLLAVSSTALGATIGIVFAAFTIIFGVVLASMILNFHRSQLQKTIDTQELRQQNEIIGLLLNDFEEGTSDWLWECDASGLLAYASPKLGEIVGKSLPELRNMTLLQATNASNLQTGWRLLQDKMESRQPVVACELEVVSAGKTTHWSINARPLFDNEGGFKGYRGVGRDISEEWEVDRKLIEAKDMAEAASAAKSTFLAVMSHELRTPLNSIVGFSEILASSGEASLQSDIRRDYAQTILESSRHLQTLITDILDATRIENNSISLVEQDIVPSFSKSQSRCAVTRPKEPT